MSSEQFDPDTMSMTFTTAPNAGKPVRTVKRLRPVVNSHRKIKRNEPCPCASGIKWKRCHGAGL